MSYNRKKDDMRKRSDKYRERDRAVEPYKRDRKWSNTKMVIENVETTVK